MSPVCAHQQPQGWEGVWDGDGPVFLPSKFKNTLEGYAAWLGTSVAASEAAWSSTAQEDKAEVQAGGQGQGFHQCISGRSLLEQPLGKVQGTLIVPRPEFPPLFLDQCKLVLPERDIQCFSTLDLELDTGARPQGKYVIRRVRCEIMSKEVWSWAELRCQCQPLPACPY